MCVCALGGFSQIPQLSGSRCLDIHTPFTIVPDGFTGTRRAVVIAINYVGQQGELAGCQNDAHNMVGLVGWFSCGCIIIIIVCLFKLYTLGSFVFLFRIIQLLSYSNIGLYVRT